MVIKIEKCSIAALFRKCFHVKDPQIDTWEMCVALAVSLNHFNVKDPQFNMH